MALVVEEGEGARRKRLDMVCAQPTLLTDKKHPLIGLTLYRDVDTTIKNHLFDRSYVIAAACEQIKKRAMALGAY